MYRRKRPSFAWFATLFSTILLLASCSPPAGTGSASGFALTLATDRIEAPAGGSATVELTVSVQGGFGGTVTLALQAQGGGAAPPGIALTPTQVQAPGGPYGLTLSVDPTVAPGSYPLQLTGTASGVAKSVDLTLTVTEPAGLSLSLDPNVLTVEQGQSAGTTLHVAPPQGFAATLALTLSDASGNPASGFTLDPASVTVNGAPTDAALSLQVDPAQPPGSYPLVLHATGGGESAQVGLDVSVAGYALDLASHELYAPQGGSATVGLTVNAYGVSGDAVLSLETQSGDPLPGGLTLQPASLAVPGGPYTLTLSVDAAVPTGSYALRLRADLGGNEQVADFTLTVQPPPEFTAAVSPSDLTIDVGASGTLYLELSFQQDFNDTIQLTLESADGSAAPAAFTIDPTSLGMAASAGDTNYVSVTLYVANSAESGSYDLRLRAASSQTTAYAAFTLTVPTLPDFTVELSPYSQTVIKGGAATYQLDVYPHNGYSGTVDLSLTRTDSWTLFDGITFTPTSLDLSGGAVSTTLTLNTDDTAAVDDYHFQLDASDGQTTQSASLALKVEDFSLSLGTSAPTLALDAGTSGSLALTINVSTPNSYDTFPNPVTFSLATQDGSPLPPGLSLSPASTDVSPGSNNLTVVVGAGADTPAGSYPLRLVAAAAGVTRSADFTLVVRSFALGLGTSELAFWTEGSGTLELTLEPLEGFSGTVTLSLVDAEGNPVSGLSLDPTSVSVSGTTTQTLTISADSSVAADVYPLRVRAVSGSIVKEADLTLSVADFAIALDSSALTIWQGGEGSLGLTVTPAGGFGGDVSLLLEAQTGYTPPSGVTLTPGSVTVSGTTTQTLTLSVAGTSSLGVFDGLQIRATATLNGVTRARTAPLALTLKGMNVTPTDFNTLGIARGGQRTLDVSIESYGVGGAVSLALEDAGGGSVPAGIVLTPDVLSVSDGTASYTLTVAVDGTVSYGSPLIYSLDVVFDGGTVVRKSALDLAVYRMTVFWLERASGTSYDLYDVAYNGDDAAPVFVAVGGGQRVNLTSGPGVAALSADGVSWSAGSVTGANNLQGVGYGNGTFVAVGAACEIFISNDNGASWTQEAAAGAFSCPSGGLNDVAYGNGTFVAVGAGGLIVRSSDGSSWTQVAPNVGDPTNDLKAVAYGNGTFVAVGRGGVVLTSSDGQSWDAATSNTTADLAGVTFGDGTFVAAGAGGVVLTSSDGGGWTAGSLGGDDATAVTYGYDWDGVGLFVVTTRSSNVVYTSDDGGASWSAQNAGGLDVPLLGAAYGNHRFVAVGELGSLTTSP
ncbi:hypothetical protein [Oceanithermus desulfurans]|uniref:DUF6242 domain-containing protein n=2 Tax=Oceanithermus desulfurans TaxID=227924 RepID=A0A511RHF2_9DEIN|nr:hypothetical protein [Oceanithermus desulfurans]MBB6029289.1 putative membrane protein [Oceanithermus desulfurans]GEM89073.1 hypothetical protein ODE01S_05070 [Oceanithermus desulfurans NBRC 100063]